MKRLLLIAGLLIIVTILALLVLGLLQPIKHSVKRSLRLKQKPETVFALLDNPGDLPNWSTGVSKVESLPDQNGRLAARLTMKWGHVEMIMTRLEHTPPTRLVISLAKDGGPVLGTWTYELVPENTGCRISLTEAGELKNPFFRAIGRMRGLDANITQTLRDLAKKFGENADFLAH